MKKYKISKRLWTLYLTTTAMMIAIGVLLPQAFHTVPNAGSIFLPMHIPVLLCGLICGPIFGLICGIITPVLSWAAFGMPPAPYVLVPMMFELMTYGFVSGLLFIIFSKKAKIKKAAYIPSLIIAMLCGRAVSIIVKLILLAAIMGEDVNKVFIAALSGAFVTCWPGLIIQLILIPVLMAALEKAHILIKYELPNSSAETAKEEPEQLNDNVD